MIYFLYGPDTYRSRRKLREIVAEFRKKSGGNLGVTRIDAGEKPEEVLGIGRTRSLFSAKELFVVEGAISAGEREAEYVTMMLLGWKNNPDLTVIFWEGEVDETSKLFKEIEKNATKAQEFKLLPAAKVEDWISREAAERGVRLAAPDRKSLVLRYGSDLWAMASELAKMRDGWEVATKTRQEEKIWNFTDAFLKNKRSSFRALISLLESGYETYYITGALAGALRNLAVVWHGLETGRLKKAAAGMNPYVVRKNVEMAGSVDGVKIKQLFADLLRADVEIKTGKLPPPLPLAKLTLQETKI